ncbi:MAG TPA: hypothetical protein VHS56_04920 [Candidatus Cybelea sp.]|nr:hypothetical protein [Candidatus Cybelea sp.]
MQSPRVATDGPTKERSKLAQCAATVRPRHHRRTERRAQVTLGARATISSEIPCTPVAIGGIGIPGFTSVAHRPTIRPPSTRAQATSTIRSCAGRKPVVSTSITQ